jgi:O-methyltransferase
VYPFFSRRVSRHLGWQREGGLPGWWRQVSSFRALYYPEVKGRTLVGRSRCFMLHGLSLYARALPGEIAEVGVYRGGTARLLARTNPGKTVHLFDTFAGMPDHDPNVDVHRRGDFADTSLEGVKQFLQGCPNVAFHQGFFPQTAEPVRDSRFCLVHIDTDIYRSVKDGLEFFYPRLVPGGVLVFDDYEWERCPGVKQAIDEFLADKPNLAAVRTTRYQALLKRQDQALPPAEPRARAG